ncbi:MAG TPA: protein kinase [Egibacteraceae bacterium]|nr:protein kinase [Egibacteraceae bacterium]
MDVSTRIAGRYRVESRLGGGGMADVFDAHDEHLDRPVAVKLLRGIDDPLAARRFADEIRMTARVNHPNIVRLFDAGEHDGSPFLVLERVTGGTLAAVMAEGPMDPQRAAAIGEQVASALSHSHAAGIVHRDVKPTNILLTDSGSVRLADFGIALTATATRLTVAGSVAGSAGYVSPEQVLGQGVGAASDVYALGLVLLECLTGAPPWSGTTVEVALARITADPPIPDDLPAGWRSLLRAMTARNPEDRPDINLVGLALSQLAVGRPLDSAVFALPAPPPDRRVPAVAGMSLMVLLASAFVVLTGAPLPAAVDGAVASTFSPISLRAAEAAIAQAQPTEVATPAQRAAKAERRQKLAVRHRQQRSVPAPTAQPQRAQPKRQTTAPDKTTPRVALPDAPSLPPLSDVTDPRTPAKVPTSTPTIPTPDDIVAEEPKAKPAKGKAKDKQREPRGADASTAAGKGAPKIDLPANALGTGR